MGIEERIGELGYVLPATPKPAGAYVPGLIIDNLCFVSGQTGTVEGKLVHTGKLGRELSLEEGYHSARLAALNCLAELKWALGSLDRVKRIVKVTGFVASAKGFDQQPRVVNGASEFLEKVFGENGKHARSAVGVAELPFGAPVEIELIAEIR